MIAYQARIQTSMPIENTYTVIFERFGFTITFM